MELTMFVSNIILSMREYQKKHNIKEQCITNVQYLYDFIKENTTSNVKTKAVLVFSSNKEESFCTFVGGHLVVVLDDTIILDPSYDIFCLKDKSYFYNIKSLVDMFNDKDELNSRFDIKKLINEHIHFTKLSDRINSGELIITDEDHYNKQADYIEKLYSKYIVSSHFTPLKN